MPLLWTICSERLQRLLRRLGKTLQCLCLGAQRLSFASCQRLSPSSALGSDKRGCYSKLDGPALSLLAAAGEDVHECGFDFGEEVFSPQKSPLLYFDFVEFFGGSGRVSSCMSDLGHSVAPPLDLSSSKHYDIADERLLEW